MQKKQSYVTPNLVTYGKLETLTQGQTVGNCDEVRRSKFIKSPAKCERIYGS